MEPTTLQVPPTGPFLIRPATAADLPAVVTLRDTLNRLELSGCPHASIQRLTVDEFTALWGATLEDPAYCWRVIETEGRLVGFGLIYLLAQTQPVGAFVQWAYLEPPYRRQGLGQLLFNQLFTWARNQGANRIELQFIDGNTFAERFWEKMGFRPYARKCVRYLEG